MESSNHNGPDFFQENTLSAEKHQRLFQRGLKWLGAGIFLMALSFGINLFAGSTDQTVVVSMYIATTLGSACIIKGLVDMLG